MNLSTYLILVLVTITTFLIGYLVGYSSRPRSVEYKSWTSRHPDQPFKRPCKHGGGLCKDREMFDRCPDDDPARKVTCWTTGVFEDDTSDGEMSVDLGGP